MANVFDYIDWRGDVPLSVDPFNEVDNLILAELVYTRFDGIVPSDGQEFSIAEANDAFFRLNTREEITCSDGYQRILPKILSIVPDTSIIGMLLHSEYEHRVVRSTASGIQQHDGMTWSVRRNRFEEAPLSELGQFIESALGLWIAGIDDETRKSLVHTIFSLFEATGMDTFSGISEQKWKSAEAVISSMAGLPRDKQRELVRILGQLLQSSGRAAVSQLPRPAWERPEAE